MATSMDDQNCSVILAVFCGLPGSGKSYFCGILQNGYSGLDPGSHSCFEFENCSQKLNFVIVCYDFLMGDPVSLTPQSPAEKSQWKFMRRDIVCAVDRLIMDIKYTLVEEQTETELDMSEYSIDKLKLKIEEYNRASLDIAKLVKRTRTVIVIDDNMYYKSMRKEYFQLARKYGIGFCQVYFKCAVDVTLRRNRCRDSSVDDFIIEKMDLKLEDPELDCHGFGTQETFVIDNRHDDRHQLCCCMLLKYFTEVFGRPVPSLIEDNDKKNVSQEICIKNFVHQADQALRKIISEFMQDLKGKIFWVSLKFTEDDKVESDYSLLDSREPAELRVQAKLLNEIRHVVLEKIKVNKLAVPSKILSAVTSGSLDDMRPRLNSFLRDIVNEELETFPAEQHNDLLVMQK